MKQGLLIIGLLWSAFSVCAQRLDVRVESKLGTDDFIPGRTVVFNGDTIHCSELRLYLGNFVLLKGGVEVANRPLDYFLIDFSEPTTTSFELPDLNDVDYDAVSFLIGVDSTWQVDGPHGGALDPAEGMYWTWQNGYIYAKLEGTSSRSDGSKGEFAWHLGGYAGALNAAVRCEFPVSKRQLHLSIDWTNLFRSMDMKTQHHVMSPSSTSVRAMEALKSGITAR